MSGSLVTDAPTVAPTRAALPVGRRRALPTGRAVTGGLLVVLAALGTYLAVAGPAEEEGAPYVVADRAVDPGQRLSAADLRVVSGRLPDEITASAYGSIELLEGAVVVAPLAPGSLIQTTDVRPDRSGGDVVLPEVALRIPRANAVDGSLVRGERVDLLATYGSGPEATTHVVARDVLITGTGATDDARLGDDGGITVTLRLPDDDTVLRATHAKDVATITLVRSAGEGGQAGPASYPGPTDRGEDSGEAALPDDGTP